MERAWSIVVLVAGVGLLGCPGEGTGPNGMMPPDTADDTTTVSQVSFADDVQPIFTTNCALSGCHAGSSPQENMNLSAGQAFANIVNVPSNQVPDLMRVRPGEPDSSYLVFKVEGTAESVGGLDTQMPLGGTPLPDSLIATIRAWIADGAPNN